MLQTRFLHCCIPYCRPDDGEHTQLVYTDEHPTNESIQRIIGGRWGFKLLRVAEEPDAPPVLDPSGLKPFAKAWLVTWQREPDGEVE